MMMTTNSKKSAQVVKAGAQGVRVATYTEKSFCVFGDTYPIRKMREDCEKIGLNEVAERLENIANNELIEGIYHNIYSDCQDNNDYKVRNILDYLGNDTEAIIDFLEENITDTGEDFFDMFYEENNFTDEQREIIRNYNGDVAFLYSQRLELFCDIRTGAFNAGEDNYIRIFEGEDWQDVAREIAEDYDKMKNSK